MLKLGLLLGLVGALLFGYVYIDRMAYKRGFNEATAQQAKVIIEYENHMRDLVMAFDQWKKEQDAEFNVKLNKLRKLKGECLDAVMPPEFLDLLRDKRS